MRPTLEHVVVVGAGLAGHAAAERLRERGFRGAITVVGDEVHRPYNRTPLSKQLLTGEYTVRDLALPAFTELDCTWRLGTAATGLDAAVRKLTLSDGSVLGYDGLVLASGVAARTLPGAPVHRERIHVLRTLEDAHGIDRALGHARDRVTIVGGGFIGCELASTARARGLDATIIDISPTLLTHGLGTTLGAVAADIHRGAGVGLHLGVGITRWEPHAAGVRLFLEDGEVVDSDTVVVGIGTTPAVAWLTGSGLDLTDGVLAGPTCHASGAEDVVVAGDAARWPNLFFDPVPRRVEHWINAIEMGQAAADNLLTGQTNAKAFTPVPRFWSEQHGVKIQSVGIPRLGHELRIVEGAPGKGSFVAAFTQPTTTTAAGGVGHRLMGVIGFDAARRLLEYAPLIGQHVTVEGTFQAQPV